MRHAGRHHLQIPGPSSVPDRILRAISGQVIEGNGALADNPELVNSDPQGAGWFFKMTVADAGELTGLMDEAGYKSFVEGGG